MLTRVLPLAGVVLFFAIGFLWRAWLQRRRYGDPGVILFRSARGGQPESGSTTAAARGW